MCLIFETILNSLNQNIKTNTMKKQAILLLLLSSLMACQRESNEPATFDNLEATGILGRWEIAHEVMNGVISDMLPMCCEFLEFMPDDNIGDYKGLLTFSDSQGLINSGTFRVDIANQMILFIDDDNDKFTFRYSVDNSQEYLTVEFTENGLNYTQDWVKVK
jgi:hypothetical protein